MHVMLCDRLEYLLYGLGLIGVEVGMEGRVEMGYRVIGILDIYFLSGSVHC